MSSFTFRSTGETATDRLGEATAQVVRPGTVIGLNGPLGAGKTRLVQAIAAALGTSREAITSPTFVLINEYQHGRLPVYHFDAYRLRDVDEFAELGPEEYFNGDGVCVVEWAERVEELLPADRVEVEIEVVGTSERSFHFVGLGASSQRLVTDLAGRLREDRA